MVTARIYGMTDDDTIQRWQKIGNLTLMKARLESLAVSDKKEISCEEVFAVLDQFAEAVHRGENPLLMMPLVRQHLDVCPDCRDEYETLLGMLQPTSEQ